MTDKPKKLSDTARALLTAAAGRDDQLIQPPRLPAAAARQVVRSLPDAECVEKIPAPTDHAGYVWRQGDDGGDLMLRATELGLARLRAEDGSSLVPPTAATLVESSMDADDAMRPGPPVAGDTAADGSQSGLDATEAPWQPAATPARAEPADAIHCQATCETHPVTTAETHPPLANQGRERSG